ncbi:MAG: bifunctional pyr operon transcriptional regulator/uracil phosphoribosyltransferase PyrR [Chitinophagales bacterium]|nr:bifunctional pyr operon transcriptional regulator/uracil phosphoribosyltransferase PyrR [Chitinophagales bacterium]
MNPRIILDTARFQLVIDRLCHQLIENHQDFSNSVIIGVQPRGVYLAKRITKRLEQITQLPALPLGKLDITFFRDDFRTSNSPLQAMETDLDFSLEAKRIILVDDVLYTGRTIRAALDAMLAYGRPEDVELLVLIDRRLQRHLPIQAKYIGKTIDSISKEKVKVEWSEQGEEDKVWIIAKNTNS